ncbi:MAG: multiheme c-type cytochrome, partial [Deferrisomatales bacterium]
QATDLERGIVALQGKAQVNYAPAGLVIQVRSKTPTYQFLVGTGAADAPRRLIADTDACLKCHVGSLYQHGGNRIDNVDMCMMCHNEASSEQNVRALDGVEDADLTYDGQAGQTYGFKSLLHAIHSTGTAVNPNKITMIYRTNGVYVWAPEGVTPPNWPGTGWQVVYGSSAPHGTATDPVNGVYRSHNLHSPTYPRYIKDCSACHVADFAMVPDQAKSVATTIDAGDVDYNPGAGFGGTGNPSGAGTVAINGNQLDDVLEGTGAAACTSCHQSAAVKAHAYQFGFTPAVFPGGRQDILNNEPGTVETCIVCHQ